MNSINFNKYLERFENVIGKGVELRLIGREMPISLREGKLYYSRFANFMGRTIGDRTEFAIDYYGYFKKSSGLKDYIKYTQEEIINNQIKTINTTVVIFNSIRLEDIKALTNDQYLLWGFIEFKEIILNKRGLGNRRRKLRKAVA